MIHSVQHTLERVILYLLISALTGGWTLVSSIVFQTPGFTVTETDDYRMISNHSTNYLALSTKALDELRQRMLFSQLRFLCHKKVPGRTFHIATNTSTSGKQVLEYFTAKTDVLPVSCGSFYILPKDNSKMANDCQDWGFENSQYKVGKWHHSGRDTQKRLFDHPAFIGSLAHWIVQDRWECDDFFSIEGFATSAGDFWKIFVR